MGVSGYLAVLARPRFRLLVVLRVVGAAAIGMVQAALATYVLLSPERAASPAAMAASFAILLLPYSLLGPFAGVLLDRLWRRQVLVVVLTLQALVCLGIAALADRCGDGALLALAVLVLFGANRFVLAGISAGTPHVVTGEELTAANAFGPTLGTAASVAGGLLGVGVRALAGGGDRGAAVTIVVAGGTCLCAALVASRFGARELGPSQDEGRESLRAVLPGLVRGARHLAARPAAWRGIALVAAQRSTFGILTALALLQARSRDPGDAAIAELALAAGCAGAGALVAALLTPLAVRRVPAPAWSGGAVALGTTIGAVGLATGSLAGLLVGAAAVGAGGQAAKVCTDTTVQALVDDDHRGRVFTLYDMATNIAIVAGVAVAVSLAPADGGGVLVPALMAAVGLMAAAAVRRAGRRDRLDLRPPDAPGPSLGP